jgi:hypothetical protein
MVTEQTVNAAIVGTKEVINDNPNNAANKNNEDDGEGEGVPVAKVLNEDKALNKVKVVVSAN